MEALAWGGVGVSAQDEDVTRARVGVRGTDVDGWLEIMLEIMKCDLLTLDAV